jgi:hypothetical protein
MLKALNLPSSEVTPAAVQYAWDGGEERLAGEMRTSPRDTDER